MGPHTRRTEQAAVQRTFAAALEKLVADVTGDRSVIAAILCGSLSHDIVWQKSDIDDDKLVTAGDVALLVDGVIIHALLVPRAEFRNAPSKPSCRCPKARRSSCGPRSSRCTGRNWTWCSPRRGRRAAVG